MKIVKPLFGSALAILGIASLLPAHAQNASPAQSSDTLEEIIVTAEKREESAQKTAISMSVYSAQDLQDAGVHDLQSLTTVDPSVNMTTSTGSAYLAIRGVASADLTETGDPAVSVARDGFFTNRGFGLFSSLYDIARVEVLKGPQGTLYGRNSTGGVVNIITQRPTKDAGGYADFEVGNYGAINLGAGLNMPLSDVVQVRLSGISRHHDGYRSIPGFPDGDDEDNKSGRAQIAFQPWTGFNGWVEAQMDRTSGRGDINSSGPEGNSGYRSPNALPPTTPYLTPAIPYSSAGGSTQYAPSSIDMNDTRFRWEFSQDLPAGLTLSYQGGHDTVSYHHALDGTTIYTAPGSTTVNDPIVPATFLQEENPTTVNHELRLSAAADARLFWQVGAFYFKEDNAPLDSGLYELGGPFMNQYLIHFQYAVQTTSKAGFGQLSFALNDQLKFSVGARYTKDHKERTGNAALDLTVASGGFLWSDTTVNPFAPIPVFLCTAACTHFVSNTPGNGDVTNSKVTYHAGVDWTPTSHSLIYAKYDTGFKSGGFNSNGSAPSIDYGPETVTSVEVGTKNKFMDDRVQANLSVFAMNYRGYQANQMTAVISGSAQGVFNAGNAHNYGAEGEFIMLLPSQTKLNVAATLLRAKFVSGAAVDGSTSETVPVVPATVPPTTVTQNVTVPLDGYTLPNAPTVSLTAGAEQPWTLGNGGRFTARIGGKYQTRTYYSIFDHPDTSQAAYATGDASLTFLAPSTKWNLQAYVHNFTDKAILANASRNGVVGANNYEFQPPRTFGAKFAISW